MKGRLFYPWDEFHAGEFEYPEDVNPTHEKGWWIAADEFHRAAPPEGHYVLLQKINWLAPIRPEHDLDAMTRNEVIALLGRPRTEQATHLAMVDREGNEISRGFVVSDLWLERSTPVTP